MTMDHEPRIDDLVKLSFFAEIGKDIASAHTLRETLNAVMERIGQIFAPLNWSLMLKNPRTGKLRFEIVIGSGVELLQGKELPGDSGIAGWILTNGRSLIVPDVSVDSRFDTSMDELTGFRTKSIIGVPLKSNDKVFGVIELVNKLDGEAFSALELKILQTIADFTAIAVEKHYYLAALRKIAMVDGLTGVHNRRSYDAALEREKARTERTNTPFTVILVDVDRFKAINDEFGHAVGDEVLKRLARILEASVRKVDHVCRIGGDEFSIILPETDRQAADAVQDRIKRNLEADNASADPQICLSIGCGEFAGSEDDPTDEADRQMYRDKARRFEFNAEDLPLNVGELLSTDAPAL